MTQERKNLYRSLVHWAMVEMRSYSSNWSYFPYLWNSHARSRSEALGFVHALSQWLHNVALYSSMDFQGFKEDWFWEEYKRFRQQYPANKWAALLEMAIDELKK